jgi:enoyl-CoA hydratase
MAEETAPRIRYEEPEEGLARIVLARPETRNAQDKRMLYELNDAYDRAAHDDRVRVIILAADGPHFSSGHDLRDLKNPITDFETVGTHGGFSKPGAEGYMSIECEIYLGFCWRWRNIPKPTIAEVQGKVIAGGLMLVWPCDLIVASEDAEFSDPVVAFGVNGHEFFVHPFELGARKAKEMLFTGAAISAAEAHALGMVNQVVPRERLAEATLALARRVASRPTMGLRLAKLAVNHSLEAQGLWNSVQTAFYLHHLGHSHNMQVHGRLVDPAGAEVIRRDAKGAPAAEARADSPPVK